MIVSADTSRLDGVRVIGVDEHRWSHTRDSDGGFVTVIIDLTPVLDGTGRAWLRPQPHQLRPLIGRKRLTPTRIRPATPAGRGHPPPLIGHPLMQQVLMQIQLTSNLGDTPIPVDHPMRRLDPVLRGKGTPRTEHPSRDHGPAISDVHYFWETSGCVVSVVCGGDVVPSIA